MSDVHFDVWSTIFVEFTGLLVMNPQFGRNCKSFMIAYFQSYNVDQSINYRFLNINIEKLIYIQTDKKIVNSTNILKISTPTFSKDFEFIAGELMVVSNLRVKNIDLTVPVSDSSLFNENIKIAISLTTEKHNLTIETFSIAPINMLSTEKNSNGISIGSNEFGYLKFSIIFECNNYHGINCNKYSKATSINPPVSIATNTAKNKEHIKSSDNKSSLEEANTTPECYNKETVHNSTKGLVCQCSECFFGEYCEIMKFKQECLKYLPSDNYISVYTNGYYDARCTLSSCSTYHKSFCPDKECVVCGNIIFCPPYKDSNKNRNISKCNDIKNCSGFERIEILTNHSISDSKHLNKFCSKIIHKMTFIQNKKNII
ncbi:hypothetical protein HZS_3017, partial [Henneguya salminicola]